MSTRTHVWESRMRLNSPWPSVMRSPSPHSFQAYDPCGLPFSGPEFPASFILPQRAVELGRVLSDDGSSVQSGWEAHGRWPHLGGFPACSSTPREEKAFSCLAVASLWQRLREEPVGAVGRRACWLRLPGCRHHQGWSGAFLGDCWPAEGGMMTLAP